MINLDTISRYNGLGAWFISISGVLAPTLAALLELSEKIDHHSHPTVSSVLKQLNDISLYLYIFFICLFLLGKLFSRKGDRIIWEVLQTQIDTLQSLAFSNNTGDLNDHHRVTLFKFKKWSWTRLFQWQRREWPRQGWLTPVIRSGHTGKNTKTIFLAPDEGRDAEGIAGLCWSSDSMIYEYNLPNISGTSSEDNKDKYCRKTHMPRWMLDCYCLSGKDLARTILAFPVKTSNGNRWGVLVYDSMNSTGIDHAKAQSSFEVVIEPIGVLVEGV